MLPFVPLIIYIYFLKKLVELFYHYDTVGSGSLPQVEVDNTRNHVVNDFSDSDLIFSH